MDQVWDPTGAAAAALAHVVEGFGPPVLGRADMLEGLLNDDVPQLPREVGMLTAAARYGVADLLAERVHQGVAADAAVTMVATEMTSRTPVDATGAQWASRVFAQVIGYQVAGPPIPAAEPPAPPPAPVLPEPGPPLPPTSPVPDAAPPTRKLDAGPVVDAAAIRAEDQETIGPVPTPAFPPEPVPGVPQPVPGVPQPVPAVAGTTNLAVAAALATGLAVVMQLLGAALPRTHAGAAEFWVSTLVLLAGGAVAMILALRDRRSTVGLAAIVGLIVPGASVAILEWSFSVEFTGLSATRHDLLLAGSVIASIAGLAAGWIAITALARQRALARRGSDGLTVGLVAVGVAFPLTNILAQIKYLGGNYEYVLGPGVTGWHIVWGLVFLVLFALPPVLSWFLLPRSSVQVALWSGWLALALAWQISDSPVDGAHAAAGLFLSWICWALALAGTLALAARLSAARRAATAVPDAAVGSPWPPNRL